MNQSREQELEALYKRVFAGKSNYIPLIVTPPCPGGLSMPELVRDPARGVRHQAEVLAPKVAAGSDWQPSVLIHWHLCAVVPSYYGAEIVYPPGSVPIAVPCFESLAAAVDAGLPPLDGPFFDDMIEVIQAAMGALPDGFRLSFTTTSCPFDLAQMLLPSDEFLAGLLTEPDLALQFLYNLTDLSIQTIDRVKEEMGEPRTEHITNRGIPFTGLRLSSDAIVNLSPPLLRQFALPVLERFAEVYGKLCIHICTDPAPSRHVLPVLCEFDQIVAIDNWQGPDVFLGDSAPARFQDRVAVITDVDLGTPEQMDRFLDWEPVRSVPRKGGRGLAVHTRAESMDEARRIYGEWQERFA